MNNLGRRRHASGSKTRMDVRTQTGLDQWSKNEQRPLVLMRNLYPALHETVSFTELHVRFS